MDERQRKQYADLRPETPEESSMRVLYAAICEEASVRDDGRVDLHGIFRELEARTFPARQDRLTLALSVEWGAAERGTFRFRIDLLDPSRAPAFTIAADTEVRPGGDRRIPPQTRLILPLDDVRFPVPGTYAFELAIGDERVLLATLHLLENRSNRRPGSNEDPGEHPGEHRPRPQHSGDTTQPLAGRVGEQRGDGGPDRGRRQQ